MRATIASDAVLHLIDRPYYLKALNGNHSDIIFFVISYFLLYSVRLGKEEGGLIINLMTSFDLHHEYSYHICYKKLHKFSLIIVF